MYDFSAARDHMVESQIRPSDVTDYAVVKAFRSVKREIFVPKSQKALAYADVNIETEDGRSILKPRDISKMVQAVDPKSSDIALDIACGRGYSSAILAMLCETVVSLEDSEERVERATANLMAAGADNAVVVKGDLTAGAKEHGPFNIIFVNGAVCEVHQSWLEQLSDGGRLIAIVNKGRLGHAVLHTKNGNVIGDRIVFDANAPTLPQAQKSSEFVF
ncbi:MAG: protein-L-isoaspartate O-methyltransferase [Hellea sp.]|nr:protein-L-isoaspartate O-methyltransferase [Hellea sp.]